MFRRRIALCAALIVVMLVFAGPLPPAVAAPAIEGDKLAAGWPALTEIWTWVSSLLSPHNVVDATCDWGTSTDPNGRCVDTPAAAPTGCDAGSQIEPNGECHPG
jgi:hypothetical protein